MYSDGDLDAAMEGGVLSPDAVQAFRAFVAGRRTTPDVDEEHFRLLTGFNDIFVSIAILLMLVAASWLGNLVQVGLGNVAVAGLSWGLAEYFTRQRRMALPSILLLLGFVVGVFVGLIRLTVSPDALFVPGGSYQLAGCAAVAAAAAWLHWRRFKVPITVAAGVAAALLTALALLVTAVPVLREHGVMPLVLAGGLTAFAIAMAWDSRDPLRQTRRSDVAFWLHLSAAPMIVHPVFSMLGVTNGHADSLSAAAIAVAVYLGLAVVALGVDRRALLVSALVYVFYAISQLFEAAGTPGATGALAALVIGSALLLLSAFWHRARRLVVARLPQSLQRRLPPIS